LMPVAAGERVLDAGCGDGELLHWLSSAGARPVGIDIAFAMAAECRRRSLLVSVQDLEYLALKSVFDWVVCFGALEFTTAPERAIAALGAALRPGGRLVLLFPNRSALGQLYAAYHRLMHGMRVHLFLRSDIDTWLRNAGMREPAVWRSLSLSTLCLAERLGAAPPFQAGSPAVPGARADAQVLGKSSASR